MPVWHVSVSFPGKPGTATEFKSSQQKVALAIVRESLADVGTGKMWKFCTDPPGRAFHAQKALSDGEILFLSNDWLSLPAIDEIGPIIDTGWWSSVKHRKESRRP